MNTISIPDWRQNWWKLSRLSSLTFSHEFLACSYRWVWKLAPFLTSMCHKRLKIKAKESQTSLWVEDDLSSLTTQKHLKSVDPEVAMMVASIERCCYNDFVLNPHLHIIMVVWVCNKHFQQMISALLANCYSWSFFAPI